MKLEACGDFARCSSTGRLWIKATALKTINGENKDSSSQPKLATAATPTRQFAFSKGAIL